MRRLALLTLLLATTLVFIFGCRNRLSPKIYQINDEQQINLSGNETYCLPNMIVNDIPDRDPFRSGDGSVLIIKRFLKNSNADELNTGLITAEREIEYRLFIEIPSKIKTDSISISDNSICRLIGLYDLPDNVNRYRCQEGFMIIDSVQSKRFTGYFEGKYFNLNNDSLIFNGRFNAKIKK